MSKSHRARYPRRGRSNSGVGRGFERREAFLVAQVIVVLVLWLTIGIRFFNWLNKETGPVVSYGLFLLGWGVLFGFTGASLGNGGRGLTWMALSIAVFIIGDTVVPPILIPYDGATRLTGEQALASDVFFYSIFTAIGLPHQVSWVLTYFGAPVTAVLVVVYTARYSAARRRIKGIMVG